jgi:hypothetical protein
MGVSVMPPAAANLADNPKNRLYRATQSGTYAVSIPVGVYEVTRQATTNIIIGSTTFAPSTALQTVFINEPQTSITFNSTSSTDTVPWLEGPIQNSDSFAQQYNFRPVYLPEENMWYCPTGRNDRFWTSTNAIDWTPRSRTNNAGPTGTMIAKKPGAGNFYIESAVGVATNAANYVVRSTNGITWSTTSSRVFNQAGENAFVALFHANTYLCAGYYWRTGGHYDGIIGLSTDAVTWGSQQVLFYGYSGIAEYFVSGAVGNGLFVLGTTLGSLRTSTDGFTWTIRNPLFGGNQISHIAYAAGRFLAGGTSGTLRTSTDSITWTNVESGMGTANINNIVYDTVNGVWAVMSSGNAAIRVSTDLVTWVSRSSAVNSFEEKAIAYGNGLYVQGFTDTQTRSRWFRVADIRTLSPSVPFTDTYIILEYKGRTRILS